MEFVAFWRGDKLREAQLFQENDPAAGWWFVVFQRRPYSSRPGEEGETMIVVSSFHRPEIPPNDFIRPAKNEREKGRKKGRSEMEKKKGGEEGRRSRVSFFFTARTFPRELTGNLLERCQVINHLLPEMCVKSARNVRIIFFPTYCN